MKRMRKEGIGVGDCVADRNVLYRLDAGDNVADGAGLEFQAVPVEPTRQLGAVLLVTLVLDSHRLALGDDEESRCDDCQAGPQGRRAVTPR